MSLVLLDVRLTPSFVFDFNEYDDLDDGQRWSTWHDVEPLSRGPEPRPDWVVTSQGAIDTELGILKTGKEADVFLLERADPLDPDERRRDGRQALPQHRPPHLPPLRRLHRGPQHEAVPRRARAQAQEHLRPRGRGRRVGGVRVGRAQPPLVARPAGALPRADRRHRDPDGVDHRRRRDGAAAGPDPSGAGPAGVVLRPAAGGAGHDGAARPRARRPVGVQHPGRGRAAGGHRPAAGRRPGRQPGRAWTS